MVIELATKQEEFLIRGMKLTINYEENTKGYLDITFGPIWDYIPLTRNYVENFLLVNLLDKNSISQITMSAAELLENAVKYSNKDGIRLVLKKVNNTNEIEMHIFNFGEHNNIKVLMETIDDMNKHDSLEFYLNQMKKSVTRGDGKSCLGLARINHEAKARITADFIEDKEIVHVQAIFKY